MTRHRRALGKIACSILGLALAACSSNEKEPTTKPTGHVSPYPSCNEIIQACHPLDIEEGPIHDCHELGHAATSDGDCAPRKDECLRICVPADAG